MAGQKAQTEDIHMFMNMNKLHQHNPVQST